MLRAEGVALVKAAAPGKTVKLDPLVFGDDGAIALRVRALGGTQGKYALRTTSKRPKGWTHPPVETLSGAPPTLAAKARGTPWTNVRMKVHVQPGTPPQALFAVFHVEPLALGNAPSGCKQGKIAGPPKPSYTWKDFAFTFYGDGTMSVTDEAALGLHVRLKRGKPVIVNQTGEPPLQPACIVPPGSPDLAPDLDVLVEAAAPGATVELRLVVANVGQGPSAPCSAQVRLVSVHNVLPNAGLLLLDGVPLPALDPVGAALDLVLPVVLPADLSPGLWALQVHVDADDAAGQPGCPATAADIVATVLPVE